MERELTCINCPMGCRITAAFDGKTVTNVRGNGCPRGKRYVETELTAPVRTVTGLMRRPGTAAPVPVKTSRPVPKDKVFEVITEMNRVPVTGTPEMGEAIIENVCGTGADVVCAAAL